MQDGFLDHFLTDSVIDVRVVLHGVGITQTVIDAMIDFIEPFTSGTSIQNETAGLPLNSQYRLELKTASSLELEGQLP